MPPLKDQHCSLPPHVLTLLEFTPIETQEHQQGLKLMLGDTVCLRVVTVHPKGAGWGSGKCCVQGCKVHLYQTWKKHFACLFGRCVHRRSVVMLEL